MVFYRSFYEAIKELPNEEFAKCARAILEYGIEGKEQEEAGIAKSIFIMARPQIDANNKRYENGAKGGRPRKPNEENKKPSDNQKKPSNNQAITTGKPNVNVNDNVNENGSNNNITTSPETKIAPASTFTLSDGTEYEVSENDVVKYEQLYPAVNVRQELRNIKGWCDANPKNRKTRSGAKRFLNAWLSRTQNSARPQKAQATNKFCEFEQRTYDYDNLQEQLHKKAIGGGLR